jgi:hypothetical protein
MSWNLRKVIGYWFWWRNHRLTAEERGMRPMDFPEYLQWVRLDLQCKEQTVEGRYKLAVGH